MKPIDSNEIILIRAVHASNQPDYNDDYIMSQMVTNQFVRILNKLDLLPNR